MNNDRTTRLHPLLAATATLALAFGALNAPAAVIEEITVRATPLASPAHDAAVQAELAAYIRSVEAQVKESVRQNLERVPAPNIRLAAVRSSRRG